MHMHNQGKVCLLNLENVESEPSQGWVFKSPTLTLSATSKEDGDSTIEVPFSSIEMPGWVGDVGGPTGAVDPHSLIRMSFEVRSVGQESADGEALMPYEIHIDDVEFY